MHTPQISGLITQLADAVRDKIKLVIDSNSDISFINNKMQILVSSTVQELVNKINMLDLTNYYIESTKKKAEEAK